jgi:hypothetical protein
MFCCKNVFICTFTWSCWLIAYTNAAQRDRLVATLASARPFGWLA